VNVRAGRLAMTTLLVALVVTARPAQAVFNPPAQDGGGGGGSGPTPAPTAPPGNMCYLSSGLGSNFALDEGRGYTNASQNWTLPGGDSFQERSRAVATGADGSETYDSGWLDETPYGDWLTGGQTGSTTIDIPGNPDMSGGFTLTDVFTDGAGNSYTADGMAYPPDPVTNSC
jgi:hypothetical protein